MHTTCEVKSREAEEGVERKAMKGRSQCFLLACGCSSIALSLQIAKRANLPPGPNQTQFRVVKRKPASASSAFFLRRLGCRLPSNRYTQGLDRPRVSAPSTQTRSQHRLKPRNPVLGILWIETPPASGLRLPSLRVFARALWRESRGGLAGSEYG